MKLREVGVARLVQPYLFRNLMYVVMITATLGFFQNCGMMQAPMAPNDASFSSIAFHGMSDISTQECQQCHEQDRKSVDHFAGEDCKGCHTAGTLWSDAVSFDHNAPDVKPQACKNCHEDDRKGLNHFAGQDCKGCHVAGGLWSNATNLSHKPVPSACVGCHGDGETYDSYPAGHIVATGGAECISCHQATVANNFTSWLGGKVDHELAVIKGQECQACHEDNRKTPDHFAGMDCKGCHVAGGLWKNATNLNHDPIPSACVGCHGDGEAYDSYPPGHLAVAGGECISCHQSTVNDGFNNWSGGVVDHNLAQVKDQSCTMCHEDDRKDPNHFKGLDCKGCHKAGGVWADTVKFAHNPAPAACLDCHGDGASADQYPPTHIDVAGAECVSCHQATVANSYINWLGGKVDHALGEVKAQECQTCHQADRKSPTHFAGMDCKGCHVAGGIWKNATDLNHNPVPAACLDCHGDGQAYDKYPADHLPVVGAECISCHQASVANSFANWLGGKVDHALNKVKTQECQTCHQADRKSPTHFAGVDCKGCHAAGGLWRNATQKFHEPVPATCSGCHADGQTYDKFPAGHIAIGSTDCKTCHQATVTNNYANWQGGTFNHTPAIIAAKNCNSCHSSDRPSTGSYMAQDPALNVTDSHYGAYDCFFCHSTNNQFRDWRLSATSHYNASGGKIESCLPCHYSKKSPTAGARETLRIDKHKNQTTWFQPPIYDINAVGNHPGATGKLGKCFSCHTRRRSFED